PQATRAALNATEQVWHLAIGGRWVTAILARDCRRDDRDVTRAARERARVIERPRQRDCAGQPDAPVGGLETNRAAERGRDADAPAGIAPDRRVRLGHDDRDGGAAGRSAGDLRRVPRIAHVPEMRIHGADAVRELVHAQLAEKYRPGLAKLAHH